MILSARRARLTMPPRNSKPLDLDEEDDRPRRRRNDDEGDPPRRRRDSEGRSRPGWHPWVVPAAIAVVCVLAVGGLGVAYFVVTAAQAEQDRTLLPKLRLDAYEVKLTLFGLQTDLGAVNYSDPRAHYHYVNNPKYAEEFRKLKDIIYAHNAILDRHPEWNSPRLSDDMNKLNQ